MVASENAGTLCDHVNCKNKDFYLTQVKGSICKSC